MDNLVLAEEIKNTTQSIQKRRRIESGTAAFTTTGTTKAILFDTAFSSTPVIMVTSNDASAMVAIGARDVATTGFTAVRAASGTSGAGFSWVAIGPA